MRTFELALVASVLLAALGTGSTTVRRSDSTRRALALATVACAALHVVVESPRWQLAPVYVVGTAAVAALLLARRASPSWPGRLAAGLGCVLVAAGAGLAWALPVAELPRPAGPHAVGTVSFVLTDPDRREAYTTAADDVRTVVAQVWYPIDAADADGPSPWISTSGGFGSEVSRWLGLPSFALDHVALVETDVTTDAPLAAARDRYPVIVYSHGWAGTRAAQSGLLEALASQGYVAVALDHTYGAVATIFPDGDVIAMSPEALPERAAPERYRAAADQLVSTFAADIRFLLDRLEAGTAHGRFTDRLDLGSVGLVGHSTGGGAVVEVCAADPRCGAVVGFDPWVEPVADDVIDAGLSVPLLSIASEQWDDHPNDVRLRDLHDAATDAAERITITGTEHGDFTLLPLLSPLGSQVGLSGPTDGRVTRAVVRGHTVAWFDRHLRGLQRSAIVDPPVVERG